MPTIPVVRYNTRSEGATKANPRWWEEDDAITLANSVCYVAEEIEKTQSHKATRDLVHASLYANQPLDSLYQMGAMKTPAGWWDPAGLGHKLTWNVVQMCIDTAAAKISKNRPRVLFLTSGGDWSLQRRAKGLTKFIDGLFDASGIYQEGQRAFVDACVFDAGVLKVWHENAEIKVERVLPGEILVNDTEAIYGRPRSMFQRKYAHRDALIDVYGNRKTEDGRRIIEAIKSADGVDPSNNYGASEMVPVYEGWHLPNMDGDGGLNAVVIQGAVLARKSWRRAYFPFPMFRWSNRLVGVWGQGLAEQLVGIQLEITKLLRTIQRAQHLQSVPRTFLEKGSEVTKSHLNNEVGAIISYVGTRPTSEVWQAMSAEVYQHLERLYAKAMETARMSALSVSGQKPPGLDAAVALREFHDIENEGFVVVAQRYEQMYLDAARMMIDIARDIYQDSSKRIKAPGTKLLEQIAWKDVNLKEDQYTMRAFPVSLLPTTPAGRLQKVQELMQGGLLDRDMAMSLLDFPDVEQTMNLQTAAIDDLKRALEGITERGEYDTPEPAQNLALGVRMFQSALLRGRAEGMPEKNQELLLRWMSEAKRVMDNVNPPPAPAAPAAPGADPAAAVDPMAAQAEAAAPPLGAPLPVAGAPPLA